jgi:hypothetical protein
MAQASIPVIVLSRLELGFWWLSPGKMEARGSVFGVWASLTSVPIKPPGSWVIYAHKLIVKSNKWLYDLPIQPARAVWDRDIYLYSNVWLVIYAIFVVPERYNHTR